jgi:hypothetical protein
MTTPPSKDWSNPTSRYIGIGLIIVCPMLILLPPRKLDGYTLSLALGTLGGVHLIQREGAAKRAQQEALLNGFPTERAAQVHQMFKEKQQREGKRPEKRGLLERMWMGQETEGWKERRLQEEREALDDGRGYTGLIKDQIWEVWNQGKKSESNDKKTEK